MAAMLPMALSQRYMSWLAAISGGERLVMDGISVVDECVITGSGYNEPRERRGSIQKNR